MRIAILALLSLPLAARAFAADEFGDEPAPPAAAAEPVAAVESAPPVPAAEEAVTRSAMPAWEISLKAGGHFPQVTNRLGSNFDAILKVGYGVALDLQVFADFAYSQPSHTSKGTDPRLGAAGAEYSTTLTVRDFATTVGADYFLPLATQRWLPYAGLGLTVHFLKTDVTGSAGGASFGDTSETSTQVGGVVFAGTGFRLGPGMVVGELRFGFAPVSQKVTGSANIGALSVLLGYGLLL
jgi:opacity protein-like surface antigen